MIFVAPEAGSDLQPGKNTGGLQQLSRNGGVDRVSAVIDSCEVNVEVMGPSLGLQGTMRN